MAFATTNYSFESLNFVPNPALRTKLADQTQAGTAVTDTGVVGNKHARVRVVIKTIGTLVATDTAIFALQVGTGAAITAPETIACYTYTMQTGDTSATFDLFGFSQNGFESYKILVTTTSSHTITWDGLVDIA